MVKDLVKELVVRSPLEPLARVVYGWVSTSGRYDRQTLAVMDRVLRPRSNCMDVGCFQGDMLREILRRAPQGRQFAIEPIPERFARLKARYPQATLFNVAASDRAGEASLRRATSLPAISGLARRSRPQNQKVRQTHVLTNRLDDLVPADVPIHFLRLDVEGAELLVLRGARQLLRRWRPYSVFAHGVGRTEEREDGPEELYDLVTESGLTISVAEDWLNGHSPLGRETFTNQCLQRGQSFFLAHP